MSRGYAILEMLFVISLILVVMTFGWRLTTRLSVNSVTEETALLLSAIALAGNDARTLSNPVAAIVDSQRISGRYRNGTVLVAPSGGTISVALINAGTAPLLRVSLLPPTTPALCASIARRLSMSWRDVRIGALIAGGTLYGTQDLIISEAQLQAACAVQPTLIAEGPL